MAEPVLIETRICDGVWEGMLKLSPGDAAPRVEVVHRDRLVGGATIASRPERPGHWLVRVPVPPDLISEGVQTFVLQLAGGGVLGHFSITAGNDRGEDLRAEIDLLRAELDLLKRAFRRHVAETQA